MLAFIVQLSPSVLFYINLNKQHWGRKPYSGHRRYLICISSTELKARGIEGQSPSYHKLQLTQAPYRCHIISGHLRAALLPSRQFSINYLPQQVLTATAPYRNRKLGSEQNLKLRICINLYYITHPRRKPIYITQ